MSATTTQHTNEKPTKAPKAGHEWKFVERPVDWEDEYYSEEMKCEVKHEYCWCGESFYGGDHEDGNHEGVWQEVEKTDKSEEQEDPDVVEVPVFGVAASDLGKRKAQEEQKEDKGKEVIDLTSDSEDEQPADEKHKMTLPMVMSYELDLPKGKKARARFDRDVDALVARICRGR
jgi:hypothetical protein